MIRRARVGPGQAQGRRGQHFLLRQLHREPRQERFFPRVTSDDARLKNAIAFNAMADGIPVVYQGQEQRYGGDVQEGRAAVWLSGFDTGTDLYAWIARLNAVRAWAISRDPSGFVGSVADVIYTQGPTVALRKGNDGLQLVSVFSNLGESAGDYFISLSSKSTGFNAGEKLVDMMSCSAVTVGQDGLLRVTIAGGLPRVFYSREQLQGAIFVRTWTMVRSPTLLYNVFQSYIFQCSFWHGRWLMLPNRGRIFRFGWPGQLLCHYRRSHL